MAELSIIVPIYNVEKYLARCIDSILMQTFTDFELILINDGSTDKCAEIMKEYAEKDQRIITIQQENRGVSAARNAGLRIATGTYVGFVDPDDWIDKEMYQKMIYEIKKRNSDLVCCNSDIYREDMSVIPHKVENVSTVMSKEEYFLHLFDFPRTIGGTVWNKVFIRENISVIFDEDVEIGEDALFSTEYCFDAEVISYIDESLYHNFERENSATRKNIDKVALILNVKRQMIEISKNVTKEAKKHAERDYLDSCFLYYNKFLKNPDSRYLEMGKMQFHEYMKKNLWSVLKNEKIYWKTRIIYFFRLFFRWN